MRVSMKVTMMTPMMLGIAVASRESSSFSIGGYPEAPHPEEARRAVSKGGRERSDHAADLSRGRFAPSSG